MGLANVAKIAAVEPPKIQGYARGGIIKDSVAVGENGIEIISPMQDYAEGQALLVAKTILAVDNNLRNMQMRSGGGSSVNYDFGKIEKKLDNVIKAFEQKQFEINMDQFRTVNKRLEAIESAYTI